MPLDISYSRHSPLPTASGPYILGIDEAGRGPVLGPLVYAAAYCPLSYVHQLDDLGFADSKTLTPECREERLQTLNSDPANLGWSIRVISPHDISSGMLRRPPTNLNRQSQDATVLLLSQILDRGTQVSEVFVDALGNTTTYQCYLSSLFPGIEFTVTNKADSKFKIVGAASIVAKVNRDACLDSWVFDEENGSFPRSDLGSGYPSDPKTQVWLKSALDLTFGFPRVTRFSWATVKTLLEKNAYDAKWIDDGQASLRKAFETGKGLDKDRCGITKELDIVSIDTL